MKGVAPDEALGSFRLGGLRVIADLLAGTHHLVDVRSIGLLDIHEFFLGEGLRRRAEQE